jgi:hypothetical protein
MLLAITRTRVTWEPIKAERSRLGECHLLPAADDAFPRTVRRRFPTQTQPSIEKDIRCHSSCVENCARLPQHEDKLDRQARSESFEWPDILALNKGPME